MNTKIKIHSGLAGGLCAVTLLGLFSCSHDERLQDPILLNFQHVLARIQLKARSVKAGSEYKISEVALLNLMDEGSIPVTSAIIREASIRIMPRRYGIRQAPPPTPTTMPPRSISSKPSLLPLSLFFKGALAPLFFWVGWVWLVEWEKVVTFAGK